MNNPALKKRTGALYLIIVSVIAFASCMEVDFNESPVKPVEPYDSILYNSIENALDMPLNSVTAIRESYRGFFYFRLNITTPGTLTVYSTGSGNPLCSLFDSTGAFIEYDNDDGADDNFLITRAVTAGYYYLCVNWGIYHDLTTLHIEFI